MINKFFKNTLFKNVSLFIGFCLMNILIFIFFILFLALSQSDTIYYQRTSLSDIEATLNGTGMSRMELDQEMKEKDSFFFILDRNGEIIDSSNLPETLNHSYSRAEIASFIRWYLDDYPVDTRILDNGNILVEGYPQNTLSKYSLTFPIESVILDFLFFPGLLLVNLLVFLFLLLKEQKKIKNEIAPVLQGIEDLSKGEKISLNPTGVLSPIKISLNRLGSLLRQREQMRSEWISEISHDIRTPLSVISTSAELLNEDKDNSEIYKERIQHNVLKIKTLVESLNLNNKLSYGLLPIQKTPQNLAHQLREAVIQFIEGNDMESYPLIIEISSDSESFTTPLDRSLFERVVTNLLANCLIHNPKGVPITISLSNEEKNYLLKISNPKDINQTEETKHTGQGLLFVQKFANEHNWETEITDTDIFEVKFLIKPT